MAVSRSSRAQPVYAESDPGGDTEPEEDTPKQQRTLSRKRISDVFDASFTSDSGRTHSKAANINDDAAEKRRRRKSQRVVLPNPDDNEAGPSSDPTAANAKQKQQLLSISQDPAINVPLDVMSSNFEEWMKMATDNKINAANSWNFALIDYFHDMSLLRNNTDNSINFQRASCTLDGCVKIWTSRVDSVGTETGKLLSNLANEGSNGVNDGDGSDNEEGGDQDGAQGGRKKKTHRPGSTLAKDVSQLRNKKLDLEFKVDPLFRKTCADFDEGGANGLLMNHLSLGVGADGSLRVVFDASDSVPKDGEDEEPLEEPPDEVDLSYLREHFLPSLSALDTKALSHSLTDYNFAFSKDAFSFEETTFFRDDTAPVFDDDDNDNEPFHDDHLGAPMATTRNNAPDSPVSHDDDAGPGGVNGDVGGGGGAAFVPFDPRRLPSDRDLLVGMNQEDGALMLDYFNPSITKNWAGPEHWKLRKVVRRHKDVKDITKELFVPVTRGAGITLPGPSGAKKGKGRKGKDKDKDNEEKRYDQTLPDDMHFSSRQLVTLFLKPNFSLKMRGQGKREREEGEIDENFWAQAAADQAAGRTGGDDETNGGDAIPFNTQFFHDDYDDGPGFDDVFDGDGPEGGSAANINPDSGEQDLLAATQGQMRRVRPEFVNYAKRAKRVDVRKLKENIWKNLDIVVPREVRGDHEDEDDMDIDHRPATDPSEPRVFDNVISGLKRSYPREKMEEISTSFCFICLLHLANERGLKLETGVDEDGGLTEVDEEELEQRKVGNIWDLKVYRDPEAIPAA
ncbi:hypothetical protein EW026_g1576 [Hermanssonia centrifuga]|uniref:Condensin complex subunit 2 n=1 Tax=Hermanssonia centrifuga TaxID=98765 RepID=A0A4S4KRU4_9APHY|nr:hypothetical protein EW026_g1576 [Hermanssonia centrifuga]